MVSVRVYPCVGVGLLACMRVGVLIFVERIVLHITLLFLQGDNFILQI